MIVTLTLNPAIDKSTEVERLIPEKKMRCPEMLIEPGGGGINVSKAISELGGNSLAVFTSGGNNGKLLEGLLKEKDREMMLKGTEILKENAKSMVLICATASADENRC